MSGPVWHYGNHVTE